MTQRWKPNVTVAAVVERNGQFLLVEEESDGGLMLNQPAGHLEYGESLIDAVKRETREETACPFVPQAVLGIYMAPASSDGVTYLRFAFIGRLGERLAEQALDAGIVRTVWLTPDEIRAARNRHRSPLLMQCVEDYLRGQRYPLEILHTGPGIAGQQDTA